MKTLSGQVKTLFQEALGKSFPSVQQELLITKGNARFGADYQCNNAMQIYKDYGKTLDFAQPKAVADAIKAGLPEDDMIGEVVVAPQGFVSLKVSDAWIIRQLTEIVRGDVEYAELPSKRVVVDFSSPNIAKDMHVGHLRSTIIGESMCRILEYAGHEVHRLNHVGDWGTQFGMLIEYMRETYPDFQKSLPNIADLQEFYKASKKRFDEDEAFKEKARLRVVDLQSGGKESLAAWQKICDVSRQAFETIYSRLGITVQERGESFYNSMIAPIVKELEDRGICILSDGAKCIWTPKVATIPLMAVKSDGGFGYDSTDLAAIYHRIFVMRADWIVYITDLGQETHFHMIFDAAEQAGWHRPSVTRCDHMGFGVVQGADGKKFKTRSGETVKLKDLLDEAVEQASTEIAKRVASQEESGSEVFLKTDSERQKAAEQIGIASVRYFDMKRNRTSTYKFSYDEMLDPKGNTAIYLFYAYARIRSIQKKSGVDVEKLAVSDLKITDPAERDLAMKLLQFPDVLESVLGSLHIHHLTDYLWEVTNVLTAFITKCRCIDGEHRDSRLMFCEATRKVLLRSFQLLGMEPLERI
jgi:arginyl-tRNA synthetase